MSAWTQFYQNRLWKRAYLLTVNVEVQQLAEPRQGGLQLCCINLLSDVLDVCRHLLLLASTGLSPAMVAASRLPAGTVRRLLASGGSV